MSVDVHAIVEIFDAVDSGCLAIVKAGADGHLTLADARFLLEPVKASIVAVRDRGLVVEETKDLDSTEIGILADRLGATTELLAQAVAVLAAIA